MTGGYDWAVRWRVRLGYLLVFGYAWLAQPTSRSILLGLGVASLGLLIRGAAAGYLRKHEALATRGPYAWTRNPLYLGSALLALGVIVAGRSWVAGVLIGAYFAAVYAAVMKREEAELRARYGAAFEQYARRVPLFFPRLPRGREAAGEANSGFRWENYFRNREWQAAAGAAAVAAFLYLKMWLL